MINTIKSTIMLKTTFLFAMVFIVLNGFAQKFELKHVWSSGAEYNVPECVLYDEQNKVLYVSNVVGSPWEKDGVGYISKADLKAKPIEKEWVNGFSAPKGMAISDGKLYVADIDVLKVVDIAAGKIIKTFEIDGGKNLNDVASDKKNGDIYFSDSGTGNLYRIRKGELSLVTNISESRINGVFVHDDAIYIGGKSIYKVDKKNGRYSAIIDWDGGVDGIEWVTKDWFVLSNWPGKIFMAKKGEAQQQLLNTVGTKNTADFEYIPSEKLLLVPTFFDNQIEAYSLKF